jgi:hypothetical protein
VEEPVDVQLTPVGLADFLRYFPGGLVLGKGEHHHMEQLRKLDDLPVPALQQIAAVLEP